MTAPADLGALAIRKLREALDAGPTPGPWIQGNVQGRCHVTHPHMHPGPPACIYDYVIEAGSAYSHRCVSIAPDITLIGWDENDPVLKEDDAAFVAACREGVPALFARVAELEGALDACIKRLDATADDPDGPCNAPEWCRAILAKGQR